MHRHAFVPVVFAALCCLSASANPPSQTDRASPPAAHCFNAREVREARQSDAQTLQRELQLDNPSVSLEQTMVAMQKAQIGFQATLQVRNRLVQAYSEIMNMQV